MNNKKDMGHIRITKNANVEREVSYRRILSKKAAKICVFGDMQEIDNYSDEFLNCVDELVSEKHAGEILYGKPVVGLHTLNKDNFYFVSSLFLKERDFEALSGIASEKGMVYGRDFIWAPEWEGDADIPACYPSVTWADKEATYDFSKQEGPWDYRYRVLLDYLPANCRSVMDCGAGNMSLQRMLPRERDIIYYPVDYKPNYPATIVCDFNRGDFPDLKVSTVFMCGLLEYIENPKAFLKAVCRHCDVVLMTYNVLSDKISMAQRRLLGWKSHMTIGDIVSIFQSNKFELVKEPWVDAPETYLVFKRARRWRLNVGFIFRNHY